MNPEPLAAGTLLTERFEIESVIGSGGFSIVYLASDHARHDQVTVKELAPRDSRRLENGVLDLGQESHRLRRKFLDEGALQARLKIRGLVSVRSWFSENGTAYVVSEHLSDATTLQQLLQERRVLDVDGALVVFSNLMQIVDKVHERGILHRDVKPSNVLVGGNDEVWLIDFGAAREWQMDAHTQTVLFTPGFSPPEQLSEKAKRGPATDIYALCATLYQMLLGEPPPGVAERAAGAEPEFGRLELSAGRAVANTVRKGLELKMANRPQTISELRSLLEENDSPPAPLDLESMDDALFRASQLSFHKRECPACGGVLIEPKPLRRMVCPVCRNGLIKHREIHSGLCPVCRSGVLHRHENTDPPFICQWCRQGALRYHRQGLGKSKRADCRICEARAHWNPGTFEIFKPGNVERSDVNRSEVIWVCDACEAQFDQQADSRLRQMSPPPGRYTSLYPEEWARVASGFEPGAGDAECDDCGAEYFTDAETLTLLWAHHDPNGFAADYEGRRLGIEDARWLGAGKMSPHRGFVCEDCGTEFDFAGSDLLLVHSNNRQLARHAEQIHDLGSWHRIAKDLPLKDEEAEYASLAPSTLRKAYLRGKVGFEGHPKLIWKGPARRMDTGREGVLAIDSDAAWFGPLLRRWKRAMEDLVEFGAHGERLRLVFRGDEEAVEFEIEPIDLTAHLKSGDYTVRLTASELETRLSARAGAGAFSEGGRDPLRPPRVCR